MTITRAFQVCIAAVLVLTAGATRAAQEGDIDPLIRAATEGNLEAVTRLLAAGVDINVRTKTNDTALMHAIVGRHARVAALLIDRGADVNVRNTGFGSTALMLAAERGDADLVRRLLDKGAAVDVRNNAGMTALHGAARHGGTDVVKRLLAAGAAVNVAAVAAEAGVTPLLEATWRGHHDAAAALLAGGADPNARNEEGATPLSVAEARGDNRLAHLLREAGAKPALPPGQSVAALVESLRHTRVESLYYSRKLLPESVKTLIAVPGIEGELCGRYEKADPDELYRFNLIIVMNRRAVYVGVEDTRRLLGACLVKALDDSSALVRTEAANALGRLNFPDSAPRLEQALRGDGDVNVAYEAFRALMRYRGKEVFPPAYLADTGRMDVARKVLTKDDLHARVTAEGQTLLMIAAFGGNASLVSMLLELGADVTPLDGFGQSALYLAAWKGHVDAARILLARGADINQRTLKGWTPVLIAAAEGHAATVRMLIDAGADVNVRNRFGRTALMFAAGYGYVPIVEMLLKARAEIEVVPTDDDGFAAIMGAACKGHADVVKLLLARGGDPNIRDRRNQTPLTCAMEGRHEAVARLLREAGGKE